jgi:hypothetical protein
LWGTMAGDPPRVTFGSSFRVRTIAVQIAVQNDRSNQSFNLMVHPAPG